MFLSGDLLVVVHVLYNSESRRWKDIGLVYLTSSATMYGLGSVSHLASN